ncbi:tRNA pseudouridine(55) synthase TruB [Bacteroidetes/Chlorobi group bacterium ChocPot_Mid]|jgi:tRNA pseudouridine55 synthase|nr:MAG: tRNA pseudouridine(55) synthase TruB [Bacteroidetes/Chlorobi group bacterium ChocPot_Mid]
MVIFSKKGILIDNKIIKKEFFISDLLKYSEDFGVFLLIDKPKDWTSFDIVAKIRNLTKIKKIGHAGTLDPLATGLLILALGRKATREIDKFRELRKKYLAEIKLGATTKSDDAEFDEENIQDVGDISEQVLNTTVSKYLGKIEQLPPVFSAQKVSGKPAYKSARKNKDVELRLKEVEIFSIEIKRIYLPFISLKIECSKGTYIRSLARDIGKDLGCGAYLSDLRRTNIGDYRVENSFDINEFTDISKLSV